MANLAGPPGVSLQKLQLDQVLNVAKGVDLAAQKQDAAAGTLGGGTYGRARELDEASKGRLSVKWEMLQQRHPEWTYDFWCECRALYAGGNKLLGNPPVLERLFPKNSEHEPPKVYEQRKKRAHYYPYPGSIIDSLLAGLAQDPLRVAFGTIDDETGQLEPAPGADWWASFVEDVSDEAASANHPEPDDDDDDDASGLPMHPFLVELMREAMQTGFTWVRCDLPDVAPDDAAAQDSELGAEQAGARAPYLCLVAAENVIDWEYSPGGDELLWVLTLEKTVPRPSIAQKRGAKEHHRYVLWTQTDYVVYELDVDPKNPPAPESMVAPVAMGTHPFACVPFDRVKLPDGLYAMGKLHNLAREHFNKRCAMSWAEYKSLFSILYEFLDTGNEGDIPTVGAADANRATDQLRAQGWTQVRRKDDKAAYIGPDSAPFAEARESTNDTMREMHRVMFSMALSANMDKQALSRSGDSKEQDQVSTQVVLLALGQLLRRIARVLLALVARGRGEPVPATVISGLEHFDVTGVTQTIADAVQVFSALPMSRSATANELYTYKVFRKIVGEEATDAQLEQIREEIEEGISAEEELAKAMIPDGTGATEDGGKGDDDEEGDGGDREDRRDDGRSRADGKPLRIGTKPMAKRAR